MLRTQKIGMNVGGGRRVAKGVVVLALVVGLVVFGYATEVRAAPGELDPSFGSGGKATTDFSSGVHDFSSDVAAQDDGKVVVAGGTYTGTYTGTATGSDFALARYNPDGTLDATFGSGGKVTTPIGPGSSSDFGYVVAIGADGKIVVAGYASDGVHRNFAVARYTCLGRCTVGGAGSSRRCEGPVARLKSGSAQARAHQRQDSRGGPWPQAAAENKLPHARGG